MDRCSLVETKRYYRHFRIVLQIISVILILNALRHFGSGFLEGFRAALSGFPSTHGTSTGESVIGYASDLQNIVIWVASVFMISILKEFEKGKFFTETVFNRARNIGLMAEITCFVAVPALSLLANPHLAWNLSSFEYYLDHVNFAGGALGTFIRYFSQSFLIGKALEENDELTI